MQVRYSAQSIALLLAHVSFSRGVEYSLRRAVVTDSVFVLSETTQISHSTNQCMALFTPSIFKGKLGPNVPAPSAGQGSLSTAGPHLVHAGHARSNSEPI